MQIRRLIYALIMVVFFLGACSPTTQPIMILPTPAADEEAVEVYPEITPFPTRPAYSPGELVEYTAQTGDTLDALAVRFNTSVEEILKANSFIPEEASTMPPGMPMQMPIYYRPLWGTPFQMIPDAAFVNGPDAVGFKTQDFILQQDGWLSAYEAWAFSGTRTAGEIIDYIALQYSVSPKLLLALLEYQSNAISSPMIDAVDEQHIIGFDSSYWTGVYRQLTFTANLLNDAYYRWRDGDLSEFDLADGSLVRPDPWQNAATVALQSLFAQIMTVAEYHYAVSPDGFSQTYQDMFGDPWLIEPHIPGSLTQPDFQFPFAPNHVWAFTGGPHTGWGSLAPWAALDFAPPSEVAGCFPSSVPTTAVDDGLVVRDGPGFLVLDLDGDGDERTGWAIFYLHIANADRVPVGTFVERGDFLGYPSCEGGRSTGTHIHIARKYNGEWMVADGPVPFVLSGWRPIRGDRPYSGWLVKDERVIVANSNPDGRSMIPAEIAERVD